MTREPTTTAVERESFNVALHRRQRTLVIASLLLKPHSDRKSGRKKP
jgi:hypothetical protein